VLFALSNLLVDASYLAQSRLQTHTLTAEQRVVRFPEVTHHRMITEAGAISDCQYPTEDGGSQLSGTSSLPSESSLDLARLRGCFGLHIPPVACALWVIMLCMGQVFADTCTVNICNQESGGIYAFLTRSNQVDGCLDEAGSALVDECGSNYIGAKCYVDCGSIYSTTNGAYWNAMQCNIWSTACGSEGPCPASVADVCGGLFPSPTLSGSPPTTTSQTSNPQDQTLLSSCSPCGSSQCSYTSSVHPNACCDIGCPG
jgi:hypothetical protein